MFFKICALKNFTTLTGKHLCWSFQAFFYRTPTVAASGFSRQQIPFFQLNLAFISDSRSGFCSEFLWKYELNLRSSHWNSLKKGALRNFANFTGKHLCLEAATRGVLCKKVFLVLSKNSQKNVSARASFLIKLQASGLSTTGGLLPYVEILNSSGI